MKRLTKLLALILAAAMALTALCATASAEDTEKGYWKLNKTWVYMRNGGGNAGVGVWKVTKDSGKYDDYFNYLHHTYKEKDDGTGAVITTTATNIVPPSQNKGSSTLTVGHSYPKSVYMSGEVAVIKLTAAASETGRDAPTLADQYANMIRGRVEKDGSGGSDGGSFRDDDTYDGSYYYCYAYPDGLTHGIGGEPTSVLNVKKEIPKHSDYYAEYYGDYFTIEISARYAKVYYEYKWTKGTPPADESTGLWTITLKKGASTRLGIDTSDKVTYSTSKKSVASVTSSGKVTAKAKGTAVITAKYNGQTQKIKIKVTA